MTAIEAIAQGFALVWIIAVGFLLGNFLLAQVLRFLNRRKRKLALSKLEEFKSFIEKRDKDEAAAVKARDAYRNA